jgi:hypothetical protein
MTDLMAGEIIAIVLLALAVTYLISHLMRDTPDVVDCGMVHDCDGCDECGAPMVIDEYDEPLPPLSRDPVAIRLGIVPGPDDALLEAAWTAVYADYGSNVVHRWCLNARRDGLKACERCARVMAMAVTR